MILKKRKVKRVKAWAVFRRGKIVSSENWYKKPMLIFNCKSQANWWWEEGDDVVQVIIMENEKS